ncbi:hypothetical protein ABT382_10455 [Streptomyces pharetrae]|uniref:hypothetical protein n=1 Tax=Streptomyces pharetrae TaxID=291370 RepID=UPI0033592ED5
MAKNKNRDRKQPQSERAQQAPQSPIDTQGDQTSPSVSPGDLARKGRQKRFGHN